MVACRHKKQEAPTIIFTLTICGSLKTLDFMEWLGIHIPVDIKEELKVSTNPVVRSVEIAVTIASDLIEYCTIDRFHLDLILRALPPEKKRSMPHLNC